jgi:RNA polymerase sigma factor (sigma-70 family)
MESFRYQPEVCSFKGWLMRLTRCRIIDHLRKSPAAKYAFVPLPSEPHTETGTGEQMSRESRAAVMSSTSEAAFEDLWDQEWKKNLIDAAMERVKRKVAPEHYQIFYLHGVKGMPARHISELLGASMTKIYVVRHRIARLVKREVRALERKGLQCPEQPLQ